MLKWRNLDHVLRQLPADEEFKISVEPVKKGQQFPNLDGRIVRNRLGVAYIDNEPDAAPQPPKTRQPAKKRAGSGAKKVAR